MKKHILAVIAAAVLLACVVTSINLTSSESPHALKKYFTGAYPEKHWALQPYTLTDPKVIALARYMNSEYALYINPTDKRGYRSLVALIHNGTMASTINRDYSSEERIGLSLVIALMTETYSRIVPIAQNAVVGNNAHAFDTETKTTILGVPHEPSFLHGHIWGRGNPNKQYIAGVALDGPIPGLIFDMRATTWQRNTNGEFELQTGNDKKVQWTEGDMEKVVTHLKKEITKIKKPYEALGLAIIME